MRKLVNLVQRANQVLLAARSREHVARVKAADRGVDELDRVERRQRPSGATKRRRHLHKTAGIAARVRLRLRREHTLGFAIAELARRFRLHEVVDARAPAAQRLVARLEHGEVRDRAERSTRLGLEALRVLQVARVLERDADRQWVPFGRRGRVGEQLRDVDDPLDSVILEVRAAARRIRDDGVVTLQRLLQLPRPCHALLEPAGVRMQRAATTLRARDVHVEAVEHGGKVRRHLALDVRWKEFLHDDSGSERIRLYGNGHPLSNRAEE